MAKLVPQPHGGAINQNEKGDPVSPDVGRPKSALRRLLDEWNEKGRGKVSKADIDLAYLTALEMDEDEMKRVATDKIAPMLVRIACRQLLKDRGFEIMERMLDRAHGQAEQTIRQNFDLSSYAKKIGEQFLDDDSTENRGVVQSSKLN